MPTEELIFRAIAHPARRNMIAMLAESPLSVKELTSHFKMSQPAVSQHLKELREAQLVYSERDGLEQRYRLTPQPLRYVIRWAERYKVLIDPAGHMWAFAGASNRPTKKGQSQGGKHGG